MPISAEDRIPLRHYIERLFEEHDKNEQTYREATAAALTATREATAAALTATREATDRRLDGLNHVREETKALAASRELLITRVEYDIKHGNLLDAVTNLRISNARMIGAGMIIVLLTDLICGIAGWLLK